MPNLKKFFPSFLNKKRGRNAISRSWEIHDAHGAPARLNLMPRRVSLPLKEFAKTIAVLSAVWSLILGSITAPAMAPVANAVSTGEERAQLEAQLKDLEGQIVQYQDQITQYQKQGKTLSGEVSRLNTQISSLNLQIRATNLKISDLSGQITATQLKIEDLQASIEKNEANLGSLLRSLYQSESASMVEVLLRNSTLSDFFNDLSNTSNLQTSLQSTISQIKDLRDDLAGKKEELTLAKADAQTLAAAREAQKNDVNVTKTQKNQLLTTTKGQESKYQAMLKDTQARAAAIRSRLFTLLGGGQMSFGQAYQFAKVAQDATGVRAAFLLAILDHESALGKNVGQCSYRTAMNPKERPVFLQITASVGIDPEKQKVSCPNADGVYGGAMGPAQFIPSTWNGYKARVEAIVGHPPSPWNNQDAFVAAALYLKDAGAATSERNAAAKYYCGGNWNRYVCTNVYGARVVTKATSFQNDIDVIGG